MDEYIPKPVMMEELIMVLDRVVTKFVSGDGQVQQEEVVITDEGVYLAGMPSSLERVNGELELFEMAYDLKKLANRLKQWRQRGPRTYSSSHKRTVLRNRSP